MKTKSIQFRISLWVIIFFLTTTLTAFFGFYWVTRRVFFLQTGNTLTAHAQKVVDVVMESEVGMHDSLAKEAFIREFSAIPGMLVVIMDKEGMIVSSSQSVRVTDPAFSTLFSEVRSSQHKFFADKHLGELPMRFIVLPVTTGGNFLGAVLVGHPLDVINQSLNSLLLTLGGVFAALVVPVSVGGYFIVKRGLQPVSDMAQKISAIGSEDLSARIHQPGTGDELENLALAFNGLLDRLNAAFSRERQFIGDVAHEVKTPISVIRSNAEVALTKARKPAEYKRVLSEVVAETDMLSNTLKNVLNLAWSQSDSAKSSPDRVNLSQIMHDLTEIADKMAYTKHLKIETKIANGVFVHGAADKLSRAALNLIDNAVKFTSAGGKVVLGLTKNDSNAVIRVEDTGQGIPAGDLPRIFDRFYRGSKTDQVLGSGLGLAITKSVVTAHGGEIRVASRVGKGSTFAIVLPLAS